MSVVKINAIHVPAGAGAELEQRFAARRHAVDGAPGFEGFQLLRPVKGDDRYFVVTTWADEASFQAWAADGAKAAHGGGSEGAHGRHAAAAGEHGAPAGHGAPAEHGAAAGHGDAQDGARRPVATGADLLEFEVVEL
ncbi:antibiotic biosynthesis monooxygenase [Curtobacterium sp. MCBD17_013]|uniref:antibiotic biosynthesis monooxygenase family protein n=1 Tax=Curtobacterium sp. MCBD17_013 TaxID=2175668 RepID=UPI000DA72ADA|nr:antibiotic biosynthesis monooxygenase [Curtobacterium sp. MCBD17_013]